MARLTSGAKCYVDGHADHQQERGSSEGVAIDDRQDQRGCAEGAATPEHADQNRPEGGFRKEAADEVVETREAIAFVAEEGE